MGLPLKLCAAVAVAMCSVALADDTSQPRDKTGSSANLGKWWVRTPQSKKHQSDQMQNTDTSEPPTRYVPRADASDDSYVHSSSTNETSSSYGYSFAQHETEHFHLMYRQQEIPSPVVNKTGNLLEQAYQKFVTDFKKAGFSLAPVSDRLTWIVFNDENQYRDFARLADGMNAPYLESYYAARSNQVVLMQLSAASRWDRDARPRHAMGGSISPQVAGMDEPQASSGYGAEGMLEVRRAVHEAAHQLAFNTGLQKRGVMYPLWISEGLATNFESDTATDLGIAGDNPPRKRQLIRAWTNGRLMSLNSFATMVNIRADGGYSANDLYAQAWAFFNFLFKNHKSELKAYMADMARTEEGPRDDKAMREQFVRAFGSMDRLEREWNRHLDSLSRK